MNGFPVGVNKTFGDKGRREIQILRPVLIGGLQSCYQLVKDTDPLHATVYTLFNLCAHPLCVCPPTAYVHPPTVCAHPLLVCSYPLPFFKLGLGFGLSEEALA